MQVTVFVSEFKQDGEPAAMLVLPFGHAAGMIPEHLREVGWRDIATAETDDRLIGMSRDDVEAALASDGYVLTTPATQKRA